MKQNGNTEYIARFLRVNQTEIKRFGHWESPSAKSRGAAKTPLLVDACLWALELDRGSLADGGILDGEALTLLELGASHDVAREGGDGVVVLEHAVVEAHASVADLVLGVGEVGLELLEVEVGLQLGVGLGDGEQAAERTGDRVGGVHAGLGGGGGHIVGTGGGDGLERLGLVGRIALDDFDEVGDEVVAALELGLDGLPGVVAAVLLLDDAVVDAHIGEAADDREHDDDDYYNHDRSFLQVRGLSSHPYRVYPCCFAINRCACR